MAHYIFLQEKWFGFPLVPVWSFVGTSKKLHGRKTKPLEFGKIADRIMVGGAC